jgi:hypothetical protein
MQGIPGEYYPPPQKGRFHSNGKHAISVIVITIIIILALFIIPVRENTYQSFNYLIRLEPSTNGEYYVYFPFYVDEEPIRIKVTIKGQGVCDLINTQHGVTLNLSGNGPIVIDLWFTLLNNSKKERIYSIEEGDYEVFINNISKIDSLFVDYKFHIFTGGTDYNIFGIKLIHWHGSRSPSLRGNATFKEDGWQVFPNLGVFR